VRSRLRPFVRLATRIRAHFDGIVASVEHGLSNSRLEGINAKIRLINKRGYGHPNHESLTAMIHLCLGDITIPLPTET
jgi:transposase